MKEKILLAGAKLAAKHGAVNVTRKMVAEACDCVAGLVSYYVGSTTEAQSAYKKHMKKLGLVEPPKEKIEAIGIKLRAKGPRQAAKPRKRSIKEVRAIRRNVEIKKNRSEAGRVEIKAKPNGKKPLLRNIAALGTKGTRNTLVGKSVAPAVKELYVATQAVLQPGEPKAKRIRPSRAKPKPPENKALPGAPENKVARLPKAPPPGVQASAE